MKEYAATKRSCGHSTKLSKGYIRPHEFANYQEAEKVIADAFVDYNQKRIHSAL